MEVVRFVTDPAFCVQFGHPPGTIETRTNAALQRMFEAHQPDRWVFGHYHTRWDAKLNGTRFTCLDMLGRGGRLSALATPGAIIDLTFHRGVEATEEDIEDAD